MFCVGVPQVHFYRHSYPLYSCVMCDVEGKREVHDYGKYIENT